MPSYVCKIKDIKVSRYPYAFENNFLPVNGRCPRITNQPKTAQ